MTKRLCDTEIAESLKELWWEAYAADAHLQIWWALNDDKKKYAFVWEKFAAFFDLSLTAHFTVVMMALYKIHEPNRGRNINVLINNLPLSQAATKKIIEKNLASKKSQIENLCNLRCKVFAHCALIDEAAINRYKIKPSDIKSVVEITFDLLGLISRAFGKSPFEIDEHQAGTATIHLMDVLNTHPELGEPA